MYFDAHKTVGSLYFHTYDPIEIMHFDAHKTVDILNFDTYEPI